MRESTYSHNEQIKHNTDTTAPLGAWRINSSELPGLICIAALRRENSTRCRLGFPCECINSLSPCQPSFGFDTNHQGKLDGGYSRRSPHRARHRQLADAAGDHRLRLRDRAVELR